MHTEFLYCTCQKSFIYPQFVIPNKSHVNKKKPNNIKASEVKQEIKIWCGKTHAQFIIKFFVQQKHTASQ